MIKKLIKTTLIFFTVLIVLLVILYGFFVIPNDNRIKEKNENIVPISCGEVLSYDFIENLKNAVIKSSSIDAARSNMEKYSFVQKNPHQHTHPLNMHLSLGWFPLKTTHMNSIFAPPDSELNFKVGLPENPVMKFSRGIISSLGENSNSPVRFRIVLTDEKKQEHEIFNALSVPVKPFRWRYYDWFYKNLYKYFYPDIEDREGKWEFEKIDLSKYAGSSVSISLITDVVTDKGGNAFAFWGTPKIFDKDLLHKEPNIILVVIDSFREDTLSKEFSPNLWGEAEKQIRFTRALSNGNMTKLSVYSMLTSRYPHEIPEVSMHYELSQKDKDLFYERNIPTLPAVLKKGGYTTAEIGSISLFSDGYGLSADLGFDESINLEHSGYSPPHVTMTGIDWLRKHGSEKFFLMLYYDGPHGPYRPPLKYLWRSLKNGGFKEWRKALYRGEIIYHDEYIKILQNYLKSSGLGENTVVIFTSDHGVAFRTETYDWPVKRGNWNKKKVIFHSHGVSVKPEDLNVPLVFSVPKNIAPLKISKTVQLLDLAPTIIDLVGIKVPSVFRGQSLKSAVTGDPFCEAVTFHQGWNNYGVYLNENYLYIRNTSPREDFPPETVVPEEMYNISEDPFCRNNLAVRDSITLFKMRSLASAYVPSNRVNQMAFYSREDMNLQLEITVAGKINEVKTKNNFNITGEGKLSISMMPGEKLVFATTPENAEIKLNGSVKGRNIGIEDILCGRFALPLIKNMSLESKDRNLLSGWPPEFDNEGRDILLIGILDEKKKVREELGKSPKQLQSMLEEWGYVN